MPRRFNTAGPNDPEDHHTLPVLARLPDIRHLIDEKRYFVLHSPRQSGKTTALLTLARELTSEGRYAAVVLSVGSGAPFRGQLGRAEDAILDAWQDAASRRLPPELRPPAWPSAPPGRRVARALQAWVEEAPRPLVVLLDEIDMLEDAELVSVLGQLREGFPDRPYHFPWSLILAGMRDAPDYKLASRPGGHAGVENRFDIRSDSLTLRDFSRDGVAALYRKHTEATGQVFLPATIDRAYHLTRGQPWLVNALALQVVEVLVQDRAIAITAAHMDASRRLLVQGRKAHFDSLAEQLHEPRLRAILEPMLRGEPLGTVPEEDRRLALDLGLVRSSEAGAFAIANPIYREVLARLLASGRRAVPPQLTAKSATAEEVRDEEPSPVLEATSSPPVASNLALASTARAPIDSEPPEELTEWFRPVSKVLPHAPNKRPPAPPKAGVAARGRRWRQRSALERTMAIAGAGCALVAAIVWLAGSSKDPAAATLAPGSSSVAIVPARTAQPTETVHSALAPVAAATNSIRPVLAPDPSSDPRATQATALARSPRALLRPPPPTTVVASESRPVSSVGPSLPALPPPDEEKMRRQLEPKVWGGEASIEEVRMLKAICAHMGDRSCRNRASDMLDQREP